MQMIILQKPSTLARFLWSVFRTDKSRIGWRTVIVLTAILSVCRADEDGLRREPFNLIGLPTAFDFERPGSVLLHGGGEITDDVFEKFCSLAGGPEARIVFVPSAGYRLEDFSSEEEMLDLLRSRYGDWAHLEEEGLVESFRFLYTDNPEDADDDDFIEPLLNATGVWFSGGAQVQLNKRFVGEEHRQTRFQQALRGIIERGGVVGGTSAGMAAMPEIMTLFDEDRESAIQPVKAVAARGLGLFHGAIVEQHFNGITGRFERFTKLLRNNEELNKMNGRENAAFKMVGLAVDEDTALLIQGDHITSLGSGSSHVFIKSHSGRSIVWHTLNCGDSAELSEDPVTKATLLKVENR